MNTRKHEEKYRLALSKRAPIALLLLSIPAIAQTPLFKSGNLVVLVEGCGVHAGTPATCAIANGSGTTTLNASQGGYGDNQGAPITLFQYTPSGTTSVSFQNSFVLPQTAFGANLPVSGEYGSSSEGGLQLSAAGQYLTLMGYGLNAPTFNATPANYGAAPSLALAQSGSLTAQSTYTPVARVVALVDPYGNVNSSSAIYNVFNTNNPRSIYTTDGLNAWISGQGSGSDGTGGVFYVPLFSTVTSPTAITGLDTSSNTISQDTRTVQVYNNTLYVAVDSKEGSGSNRAFVGKLGSPPATSLYSSNAGPTQLTGFATSSGKVTITTGANSNGNNLNAGLPINIDPANFFFASPSVLYVADGGRPKNDSNGDNNSTGTGSIGDGGLQKWVNSSTDGSGTWSLKYTLYKGLNLVNNGSASGVTGLYGLAGAVNGNNVQLFATDYTLNDLDTTHLYGITDNLTYTTASQAASETFTLLDTAPVDSNFKGVTFAPTVPNGDVTITTSPSGFTFTSAGSGCAPGTYIAPQTLSWTPNSTCTLSVTAPQSAPGGVSHAFVQWEDGTTSTTHTVVAPSTPAVYTAAFTPPTAPTVNWPAPAAITYGSALSAQELNATASVPGTFVYSPLPGTVLPTGANQTLSVTFTPVDTTDYTPVTTTTSITVNPVAPPSPASLTVTRVLSRGTSIVIQLTVSNTGGSEADNVTITSVKVGSTAATPATASLGTIVAGSSATAAFTVPVATGASGASTTLSVTGTFTGGTFASNGRIVLP